MTILNFLRNHHSSLEYLDLGPVDPAFAFPLAQVFSTHTFAKLEEIVLLEFHPPGHRPTPTPAVEIPDPRPLKNLKRFDFTSDRGAHSDEGRPFAVWSQKIITSTTTTTTTVGGGGSQLEEVEISTNFFPTLESIPVKKLILEPEFVKESRIDLTRIMRMIENVSSTLEHLELLGELQLARGEFIFPVLPRLKVLWMYTLEELNLSTYLSPNWMPNLAHLGISSDDMDQDFLDACASRMPTVTKLEIDSVDESVSFSRIHWLFPNVKEMSVTILDTPYLPAVLEPCGDFLAKFSLWKLVQLKFDYYAECSFADVLKGLRFLNLEGLQNVEIYLRKLVDTPDDTFRTVMDRVDVREALLATKGMQNFTIYVRKGTEFKLGVFQEFGEQQGLPIDIDNFAEYELSTQNI